MVTIDTKAIIAIVSSISGIILICFLCCFLLFIAFIAHYCINLRKNLKLKKAVESDMEWSVSVDNIV